MRSLMTELSPTNKNTASLAILIIYITKTFIKQFGLLKEIAPFISNTDMPNLTVENVKGINDSRAYKRL